MTRRPLDRVGRIKLKLGLLVAVSVVVASVLTVAGLEAGVPASLTVLLVVALALVVTQVLAHGMTAPLRQMTAAARRMAVGDYRRRVTASSRDEVGELARAFNTMAADLEAVDRQRRELVANVSHELRTPVSALRAVLENLVDGVSPPEPATLAAALSQTERLGRLVDDLLDLSRVDAGIVPLTLSPVPVRPLAERVVQEASMVPRGVAHAVEVDPPDLVVTADPDRLHQLLANLLDNAARHSPDGGTVTLAARRDNGAVVLEVTDEGPGIAAEDRRAVFERFTSGGAGGDGGTGLGLAISRWVADLHGGGIAVLPSASGCRIAVSLPDRPPEAPPASPDAAAPSSPASPTDPTPRGDDR